MCGSTTFTNFRRLAEMLSIICLGLGNAAAFHLEYRDAVHWIWQAYPCRSPFGMVFRSNSKLPTKSMPCHQCAQCQAWLGPTRVTRGPTNVSQVDCRHAITRQIKTLLQCKWPNGIVRNVILVVHRIHGRHILTMWLAKTQGILEIPRNYPQNIRFQKMIDYCNMLLGASHPENICGLVKIVNIINHVGIGWNWGTFSSWNEES